MHVCIVTVKSHSSPVEVKDQEREHCFVRVLKTCGNNCHTHILNLFVRGDIY